MFRHPLLIILTVFGLFFLILGLFGLAAFGVISIAFSKLGMTKTQAFFLLIATLIGGGINIPLHTRRIALQRMPTQTPSWPTFPFPQLQHQEDNLQTIAVNVGGCLIPVVLSAFFARQIGFSQGLLLCFAIVSITTHLFAKPVSGFGIRLPFLVPPLVTALAAWILAPKGQEPAVAYISGSLGTLLGANVLHLLRPDNILKLDAPMLSIGGPGTFNGIFLTGLIALLLA